MDVSLKYGDMERMVLLSHRSSLAVPIRQLRRSGGDLARVFDDRRILLHSPFKPPLLLLLILYTIRASCWVIIITNDAQCLS